ncbi:MAG TPA: hypothetical protein VM925_10600 [Labilithrix sp.]|nr:hypothetical protein [Labilithrix sp.]
MAKPRNDRNQAVTKFCLSMEEHRRTDGGRVRTAKEFVANFFPYDERGAVDKVFKTIPNEIRGPILSTWGIRGGKAALKDDDEKVKSVVHDALVAGDIDEGIFEDGVGAQILVDWIPLAEWWSFWRHGKLTGVAIQKALATARELELIDDRWFLANVQGRGGKLKGTDVVCDTLSKDQIVAWMRKLHESGDGSPAGLVAALGWETILAKTAQDALLFALDAFAKKAGLVPDAATNERPAEKPDKAEKPERVEKIESVEKVARVEKAERKEEPIPLPSAARTVHEARTEAPSALFDGEEPIPDSGLSVAIPDIPVIDSSDEEEPVPNTPVTEERATWNGAEEESPRLFEARAKMMEMLGNQGGNAPQPAQQSWIPSDVPEKPSSLEWPEPPPIASSEPKGSGPPPLPKKGPSLPGRS